jgi:hypothetical protein
MEHRGRRWSLSELWWSLPRIGRVGNGKAIGVLSVWIWWDRMLQRRWKLELVRPDGIMRYRLMRHPGRELTLKDGTLIKHGDLLVEVHFDNARLMSGLEGVRDAPFHTLERIEKDFAVLSGEILEGKLGPVRAMYAATLFSVPARRVGFELHPVPHTLGWSLRRYFLIGLIPIYQQDGWKQFDRMRRTRWPAELWMSVKTMRERQRKAPA